MDDESADWQPLKGFPGYSVNPLGQIRNDSTKRVVAPRFNQAGVAYVGLMRGWDQKIRSLPLLVAQTYLPKPNKLFDTPIQLDGDRRNCRVDNLMWRPRWYAVKYNRQFEEPYPFPITKPVRAIFDDGEDDLIFPNSLAAACTFGLLESEVVMSVLNRTPAIPTYQYFELAEMT